MPTFNDASGVFLGTTPIDAIYARNTMVWPTVGAMGDNWLLSDWIGQGPILQAGFPVSGWSGAWNGNQIIVTVPQAEAIVPGGTEDFFFQYANIGIPNQSHSNVHSRSDPVIPVDAVGIQSSWNISVTPGGAYPSDLLILITATWYNNTVSVGNVGGFIFAYYDAGQWLFPLVRPPTTFPLSSLVLPEIPIGRWSINVFSISMASAGPSMTIIINADLCEWVYTNTLTPSPPTTKIPPKSFNRLMNLLSMELIDSKIKEDLGRIMKLIGA